MPALDPAALAEHDRVHAEFADAVGRAETSVATLFRRVQRRVLIEALATVDLVTGDLVAGDFVAPPRRRFLSLAATNRIGGCSVAFRHVDSRLTMWRAGHLGDAVGVDTATVLHSLAESHDPDQRETNPGLVRQTAAWFDETESNFEPPSGDQCVALLDAAVAMANQAPAPAIARAGWLCAAVLAIHPFVDGNGRTARLLFHCVSSSNMPLGVDWGSLEMWTRQRSSYIAALKASQAGAVGAGAIDATPFMSFALDASTAGAVLVADRLAQIDDLWHGGWESSSDAARMIELAVFLDSTASLSELSTLVEEPSCSVLVDALVTAGRLVWNGRGLLSVAPEHPMRAMPDVGAVSRS